MLTALLSLLVIDSAATSRPKVDAMAMEFEHKWTDIQCNEHQGKDTLWRSISEDYRGTARRDATVSLRPAVELSRRQSAPPG